jgi:hypothetical protein
MRCFDHVGLLLTPQPMLRCQDSLQLSRKGLCKHVAGQPNTLIHGGPIHDKSESQTLEKMMLVIIKSFQTDLQTSFP